MRNYQKKFFRSSDVECPKCKAKKNQSCVTSKGRKTNTHDARFWEAEGLNIEKYWNN